MTDIVVTAADRTERWVTRIHGVWQQSVEAIIETGRLIAEAKAELEHGEFTEMIETKLPFTARTAQRLMAIAADERLTDKRHAVSLLPPHWGTLYEMTKLEDKQLEKAFAEGVVRPELERAEVIAIRKAADRQPEADQYNDRVDAGCTLEDLERMIAARRKFGAIYADPPWLFKTYSEKGEDRSPDYKRKALDAIKALPVKDLAADKCVLFIWVLMNQLPEALQVIDAWGFKFKTCAFTWVKQNLHNEKPFLGMGYWTRANAELCLLATKGSPKRIDAGVPQVLLSKIMEHSRKPDDFADRIKRLVAGPYLELYARREREGWVTWGNEISRARFLAQFEAPEASPLLDDVHDETTGEIIEPPPARSWVIAEPIEAESPHLNSTEDDQLDIPQFLRRTPVASASNIPNASAAGPPNEG